MYRLVTDIGEVRKYLSGVKVVAFDFETAPDAEWANDPKAALDPHRSHIVGVSFSVAENDGIYVPVLHKGYECNVNMQDVVQLLAEFANDEYVIKVAHNIAFESGFLYALGIIMQEPVYDTMAASLMTNNGEHRFRSLSESGLKTLVPEVFHVNLPSYEEVTGGRGFDSLNPEDPETIRYAVEDSMYALKLYHEFNERFDVFMPKHRMIVEHIESPTAVYCGIMKYNGLLVDTEHMSTCNARCATERERLRDEITAIIGKVDIGKNASTKAFKSYLYDTLKLKRIKVTATDRDTADDTTLILLAEQCEKDRPELVPLFKKVQEYRRWGKIQSTYVEGYAKYVNPATGRIHADLLPLATETGRFAARNPNTQNSPKFDNDEAGVRNFFVAPSGCKLLEADESQIELRTAAFYCRDANMLDTYRAGGDIHAKTTSVIYKISADEASDKNAPLYKTRRTISKNCNFGVAYGLFPNGLYRTLKFKAGLKTTLAECTTIINNLKAGYPDLMKWQETMKETAHGKGYVETYLGRRRYLPDINSEDWGKRTYSERAALNSPIQGTAADLLKIAITRVLRGLPERPWLKPIMQVHDSLAFEVPEDKVQEAAAFIKSCMEAEPFPEFDVPLVAEVAVGDRYGELKDITIIESVKG